jgi:hypothetical protein
MKIRAKIESPSKANRLRKVQKHAMKSTVGCMFNSLSGRMLHARTWTDKVNGMQQVITIDYPLND